MVKRKEHRGIVISLTGISPWIIPFVIFSLRVFDMSMDTLRVLFVIRGMKTLAWILGFLQSATWVLAITTVLSNLDNVLNVVGYAAGFATGNVVGMRIEGYLAIGHSNMRIISSRWGSAIVEVIRKFGNGATEIPARGKDGTVTVIDCSVRRRDVDRIKEEVSKVDEDAFITVEDIRPLHRGFWRA